MRSALIAIGLDGRMYAPTLSVTSSIAYYGANPKMPFFMRNTPKPHGRLIAYEPESFFAYFIERIESKLQLLDRLKSGEEQERLLRNLQASLSSLHLILAEARDQGEINDAKYQAILGVLDAIEDHPNLLEIDSELMHVLELAAS